MKSRAVLFVIFAMTLAVIQLRELTNTSKTMIKSDDYAASTSTSTKPRTVDCVVNVPCVYPDSVDLRIIVMTFNRAHALKMIVESVTHLDTMGDTVALEIWIDRNKQNEVDAATLEAARSFNWTKGPFRVHVQSAHAGIYGQWIDTWRPKNNSKELAMLLEDDLIISPHAWRWLKAARSHYGDDLHNMGYTLTSESVKTAIAGSKPKPFDGGLDSVYYFKRMGSWGFAPRPAVWRDFQDWYHVKVKDAEFRPYVNEVIMTSWYKKFEKFHTEDSMWTMWFIYYTSERNLYCLYNNINHMTSSNDKCLAVHRAESGLHHTSKARANASKLNTYTRSPKL